MKTYELAPIHDRAKSFYGKATVTDNGTMTVLRSYQTDVCAITKDGHFLRFWTGESTTTMRHINEFLKQNNFAGGGLAWWRAQEVQRFNWIDFYCKTTA